MPARQVKGRKVRYAVVGGGWISQAAFMPGVGQTTNSEMTALVTGDPVKAEKLAALYGLKSYHYDDYAKLLSSDEIDAIYLALPNDQHEKFAVPALEAGIHVLLEKPMAVSASQCEAINTAAKASGAKLLIAYRLHFEPGTLEAIRRVRSGEFGEIRSFVSNFSQFVSPSNHRAKHGYWAGPVTDMGPYPLNAVRNLFGAEPVEVSAMGIRTPGSGMELDDTVAVTLRFPDERLAQFTVSYTSASTGTYRVTGTKGDLYVESAYGFGPGVSPKHIATVEGETSTREFPVVDQFAGETDYFSDCILNDRDPEPGGEEGLLDVRVLEAIERALETGQPQTLPPARRSRPIDPDQGREFPLAKAPELIDAKEPGEG